MELTPEQVTTLEIFTSDTGAYEVVSLLLKDKLEKEKERIVQMALQKDSATNEDIGALLRGCGEGMRLVEAIFREIDQYKKTPNPKQKVNRAR